MNTWETQRETLRDIRDFLKGQLPDVIPEKHMARGEFNSVQFSHSVMSDALRPHGLKHARLPCPSPTLQFSSVQFSCSVVSNSFSHQLLELT